MEVTAKKMKKYFWFGDYKYIRLPLFSAMAFAVIDAAYLCALHLFEAFGANDDGVIEHTWSDITWPMRTLWFNAHQPWSGFIQPYFIEIWTRPHSGQVDTSLIYQFEALCVLQSVLIGLTVGVLIAALSSQQQSGAGSQ